MLLLELQQEVTRQEDPLWPELVVLRPVELQLVQHQAERIPTLQHQVALATESHRAPDHPYLVDQAATLAQLLASTAVQVQIRHPIHPATLVILAA